MPRTSIRLLGVATATVLVAGFSQLPGSATVAPSRLAPKSLEQVTAGLGDLDARGVASPTAAQKSAVAGLSAAVRWNAFGTPASISPVSGSLGAATSSDAATAAKSWLVSHASVFGLSAAQLQGLTLVNDQKLAGSPARAVLFRQDFGGPAPALDSMVTVGVGNGAIQYVSSSLVRTTASSVPAATLSPTAAWVKAAASIGRDVSLGSLSKVTDSLGWSRFTVPGFAQEQQVRLRSLAYADGTVRPAFEANVVDVKGGAATAYTVLVDAISGKILVRQNKVDESSNAYQFQGAVTATECGPKHQFELTDDNTKQIVATAAEAVTTNDITVKIFSASGTLLTTSDTATSPEVATYSAESIPKGVYSMQVCPFEDPTVPFVGAGDYAAGVTTSDSAGPTGTSLGQPKWRYFTANPTLDWSSTTTPKNSVIGCWTAAAGCTSPTGPFRNVAAAGPWDYLVKTGTPSFTTVGNNANTHEAWASPDSPGGLLQAPVSPTREYTDRLHRRVEQLQVRPDAAAPDGQRHRRLGDQPARRPQPDARLLLLPGLHRGELQPAGRQPRPQRRPDPWQRPRDRQRAGRCPHRRPAVVPRPRQRQPDRPAGRRPRHHQPVPLPAPRRRVLLPLRRRQPRHEHRRPRVHPRDQQPDDRRARRGHHLRAGRRHGRVLG